MIRFGLWCVGKSLCSHSLVLSDSHTDAVLILWSMLLFSLVLSQLICHAFTYHVLRTPLITIQPDDIKLLKRASIQL
jgi:hypothetical protein